MTRYEDGTDDGLAQRFVRTNLDKILFVGEWGKWLTYDGTRWQIDTSNGVTNLARELTRQLLEEAAKLVGSDPDKSKTLASTAHRARSASRIKSIIQLAKSDPRIQVPSKGLDVAGHLLNCPNGTLDLRNGELKEHSPEHRLTKLAGAEYDAGASCPRWQRFLEKVQPDAERRDYLQRAVGYSLSANTGEECIFINVGGGRNGKTTFIEVLRAAIGDYGLALPPETILKTHGDRIPNDIAQLPGRRFATISETAEGSRLDEEKIKRLSSGDTTSARFMRGEFFEFVPVAKFWMSTNHEPGVRGNDDAIWRRIRLIPWDVQIDEKEVDRSLRRTLIEKELPGILAWAAEGYVRWTHRGLAEPQEIKGATARYRRGQDVIQLFLDECCERVKGGRIEVPKLRERLKTWCEENGYPEPKAQKLGRRLSDLGYGDDRDSGTRYRTGLELVGQTPSVKQ